MVNAWGAGEPHQRGWNVVPVSEEAVAALQKCGLTLITYKNLTTPTHTTQPF